MIDIHNPTTPSTETNTPMHFPAGSIADALDDGVVVSISSSTVGFIDSLYQCSKSAQELIASGIRYIYEKHKQGNLVLAVRESEKQLDWAKKVGHAMPTDNIIFFEQNPSDALLNAAEDDTFILTLKASYNAGDGSVTISPALYELSGTGAMQIRDIFYVKDLTAEEFLGYADRIH
ncbi:MAG: hypothetical protein WC004_01930 [Candidatus Absconditabacterales bacterium]